MEMMMLSAAAPVLARLIGEALASGDRQKAEELRKKASAQYNIDLPELPQLEAQLQGNTEYDNIKDDTRLTGIENDALDSMVKQSQSGDLTPEEQMSMDSGMRQAGEYTRGQIGAGRREREMRGTAGGGMDALDEMVAQQGAGDRANQAGLQAAAMASQRRQNMLGNAASYSRALQGDRFSRGAQRASAQDAINARNTGALNEIHKFNVGTMEQGFENQLGLADRKHNDLRQRGNDYDSYADQTVGTTEDVGQGVSDGINSYGKYSKWGKK